MSLWNESLNTFAANWLETLIRACWQGGLALALVWMVCRWGRLPAAGRCWLWRLAYLKFLVALLWLPTLDLPLLPPADPPVAAAFQPSPTAPAEAAITVVSLPIAAPRPGVPSAVAPTVAGWLLLLWMAVLVWQAGQAVRQSLTVRRLRRSGTPLNGGTLDFWNLALSRDLNLTRVPQLLSSTATDTPLLIGIRRPCIVLPESLLSTCTHDELRLILAHELAHVRRRDLLWGWLPLLARLICSFHPLLPVAERELSMAQEIDCDETALHLTGAASAAYGSLLVRVAARFAPRPSHGFGMIGMTESYLTLKRRLSAMKSFPSAPRHYRVAVRFGLLTLGLAALAPWRVAAQATPPTPALPTVPPAPPAAAPALPAQTAPAAPTAPATPARAHSAPTAPVADPQTPALPATPTAPPSAAPATPLSAAPAAEAPTVSVRVIQAAPRVQTVTIRGTQPTTRAMAAPMTAPPSRTVSVTIHAAHAVEAPAVTMIHTTGTAHSITIHPAPEEKPTVSATVGYPIAAPGMAVSAGSAVRAVTVRPDSTQRSVSVSRVFLSREGARVSEMAAPAGAATRTITATVNISRQDASADASRRTRRSSRGATTIPATPPAAVGRETADPAAQPPAAAPTALPTVAPEAPTGIPADPAQSPTEAPKALPTDPVAAPPAALPAPPTPKRAGAQKTVAPPAPRGISFLVSLPVLGRLFQIDTPLSPVNPSKL